MRNLPLMTVALAGILIIAVHPPPAHAQTFSVIYSFQGGTDGQYPISGLISDRAGNLYGMTNDGGVNCTFACGVVYELSPVGTGYAETVIHRFSGPPDDGKGPLDDLVFGPDGGLYGTTTAGGPGLCRGGCGTVFRLTNVNRTWNEEVLYSFDPDNQGPNGGVVFDKQGNIYGTTAYGGVNSEGTVFELTRVAGGWTENTIFEFAHTGLAYPVGNLLWDEAGNLYGEAAGSNVAGGGIFELTPSATGWTGKVIYLFSAYSSGDYPTGGLTARDGKLYGTTQNGGVACIPSMYGCGVVFELAPTANGWKETVLHTFTGGADGYFPADRPVFDDQGNLYATASNFGFEPSAGVVFRLEPTGNGWHETVLYTFTGGLDGSDPMTKLLFSKGRIFGTAMDGGADKDGTVFQISPSH